MKKLFECTSHLVYQIQPWYLLCLRVVAILQASIETYIHENYGAEAYLNFRKGVMNCEE